MSTDVLIDTQPWMPFSTHDPKTSMLTPWNVTGKYKGKSWGAGLKSQNFKGKMLNSKFRGGEGGGQGGARAKNLALEE